MLEVSNDVTNKLIEIIKNNGGKVYEQERYLNFFGVRDTIYNNTFNDTLYIFWKEGGAFKCIKTTGFTTKPGPKHIINYSGEEKEYGIAIFHEGWHEDIWIIGTHGISKKDLSKRYTALVNGGKPATFTRDNTQYGKTRDYVNGVILDVHDPVYTEHVGLNLHKPSGVPGGNAIALNGQSLGCQVFQKTSEFEEMMTLAHVADQNGQKRFSYFLINKNAFEGNGVVDNTAGAPYNPGSAAGGVPGGATGGASGGSSGGLGAVLNNLFGGIAGGLGSLVAFGKSVKTDSFGLDKIFGKVFPDDDNNRYIDMSSEDIAVIQYTEPNLTIDELNISNKSVAAMGVKPDKISYYIPVVYINNFMIPQTNITNFCLDYSSFTPTVMVEFIDITNELLTTNIPKPGSYIKVLVGGGYGDEKYYKPIRQDFVITYINKVNKTGGDYQNSGNPFKYRITGILNVPLGFRKMSWSSSKINARQAMFNISQTVGLGFSTNFNTNNDKDVMRWVNTQNKSYYDFMKDITRHSCYSPYTFFTSFIDQYYVLNFVECRRLLSHGGKKTDSPQMIYNCILPNMSKKESTTDDNLNNGSQKLSYYFLTNDEKFKGWTNYVEEYYEINDGNSIISDGYSKTLTYSDKCGFADLMTKNYRFLIMPIDNMKRDEKKYIVSLPETVANDTYIPLNLRQTTNSAYINSNSKDESKVYDNPVAAESTVDLGEIDTSNNFPLYFYAPVQNDFQMKNLKKCGLSVRLQNYNPSITKYSRIWVDIYDMNENSSTQLRKNPFVDKMADTTAKEYLEAKNDNIISFEDEEKNDNEYQVYNRALSGWYVVTEMKISYNTVRDISGNSYKKLQTQLMLNRIDYKPSFHSEYEMARQAIEKYKGENNPENLISGISVE